MGIAKKMSASDFKLDRLMKKAKWNGDCLEWQGYKNERGYGKIGINKKLYFAHRVSYLLHYNTIDENLMVCHTCDNPPCINPKHLFLGTAKDNFSDAVKKGRNPGFPRESSSGPRRVGKLAGAFKNGNRWKSIAWKDGKTVYLGSYETEQRAHEEYLKLNNKIPLTFRAMP